MDSTLSKTLSLYLTRTQSTILILDSYSKLYPCIRLVLEKNRLHPPLLFDQPCKVVTLPQVLLFPPFQTWLKCLRIETVHVYKTFYKDSNIMMAYFCQSNVPTWTRMFAGPFSLFVWNWLISTLFFSSPSLSDSTGPWVYGSSRNLARWVARLNIHPYWPSSLPSSCHRLLYWYCMR